MTRTLLVVGIGAGSPEHLTLQAVDAMARTDVFLLLDKPGAAEELTDARAALVARFGRSDAVVVRHPDAVRDRSATADGPYRDAVRDWREARVALYGRLLDEHVAPDGTAAVLVWGDPALYDGTITVVEALAERTALEWSVIPGISSVAALTASHRIPLNRVGGTVLVTPARRIADGLPPGVDDAVVMLDGHDTYASLPETGLEIFWGAYLGTPDEVVVAGALPEVAERIASTRAEARARKGWIMDTYLVRRTDSPDRGTDQAPD